MKRARYLMLAEPATVFALIMLYIWRLRYTAPRAWIYILAAVVASHILRRERSAGLGFRWRNFKECMEALAPAVALLGLSLLASGVLLQTRRNITLDKGLLCFLAYCPWGLFQQYLLNGYFANRLLAVASAHDVLTRKKWESAALGRPPPALSPSHPSDRPRPRAMPHVTSPACGAQPTPPRSPHRSFAGRSLRRCRRFRR